MWLFSFLFSLAMASTPRISSISKDFGASDRIFLKPGLASVIEFPKPIIEVRVGNPNSLKTSISTVSPKELTIFADNLRSGATNLIVRSDKRIYIFDVTPSSARHQDYIKIQSGFGAPEYKAAGKIIDQGTFEVAGPMLKTKGRILESTTLGASR